MFYNIKIFPIIYTNMEDNTIILSENEFDILIKQKEMHDVINHKYLELKEKYEKLYRLAYLFRKQKI
jgi:hypothetical protein